MMGSDWKVNPVRAMTSKRGVRGLFQCSVQKKDEVQCVEQSLIAYGVLVMAT